MFIESPNFMMLTHIMFINGEFLVQKGISGGIQSFILGQKVIIFKKIIVHQIGMDHQIEKLANGIFEKPVFT